ncbi:MAG: ATP-binding protein [Rhodoferax sp.]
MPNELQQLEAAIDALQAQRAVLGNAVVDTALGPLRARLAAVSIAAGGPDTALAVSQNLKQVTVLFLDVVDSTALSQHLDPEEVHAVMDDALARCTAIVEAHRGKVLKYAGDSLLAAFGADEVHEDDAERAVIAGLELLQEGKALGELVLQRHRRAGFNVRVGLHTGAVLLGGGLDAQDNIRGFTVNLAARMEQTAPAGTLRISHETYRHVRGVFDVEPQAPITVKGVDAPLLTYLVQRRKPRAFRVNPRGIDEVEPLMVGRDAEMEQLQDAFKRLYSDARLSVVTVVGEAGLGKSRLLYEFENWAEARPEIFYFFQGRSHPLTQTQPYGLLRDILAWRLQIADSDSMEVAKQKIEQGLVPLFRTDHEEDMAQAHAHLLGHLIGLDFTDSVHIKGIPDDAKQIRNRGFHAAAQMFRRFASQNNAPVLLQLDDLNWTDEGSLDFLCYLIQVNRDVPMLIVALARPTLFERRADWPGMADSQRITLGPLDPSASRQLLSELLKKLPQIPPDLRALVTRRADGNPFYMEELVKMLVDEGAIEARGECWRVNQEKLLELRVPQTLTGVLQARLDGLQPAEKLALQQASVIGFVFWDQALAAMDPRSPLALPSLIQHELTVPHLDTAPQGDIKGAQEYAFSHQLLHQVTYDTLLKPARRKHHAEAARWLAAQTGARANDFLGITAEHFVKAGDSEQACEFFTRAAEYAALRYAHEAVTSHVASALALTQQQQLRWRLLDVRERTLELQGKRTEQQADIDALQELAVALNDDARRCEVAWRRSTMAMRNGEYHAMEQAARDSMTMAERAGDDMLRLRGQHRLALALAYLGATAQGHALAQQGLDQARALGARPIEALFLNALSVIADSQSDQLASLEMDRQDLMINRELGNRRNEAIALGNLGNGWLRLGEHSRAMRYLEDSLKLARAVGDRATEPNTLTNLSVLAWRQGDDALALRHAQSALDIATEVESPVFQAIALCSLGNAELALGRHAAATAAFARASEVASALGNATRHDAAAGLARVALAQNDTGMAMQMVEDLLTHICANSQLDGTEAPYLIRLTCHQVLAHVGDARGAQVLGNARAELLAQAVTINDPGLRHSFLDNIPEHRAIMANWTPQQAARRL